MTRRKGETASRSAEKNGYTPQTTQSQVGPQAAKAKKKGNRSRPKMPCVLINPKESLLALIRILPDKKPKPCKKQNHEAYSQNPGKHHVIEKHDWPPGPCFAAMGSSYQTHRRTH
ncbi:hypothetical protein HU727_025040 [Pseudomonas sp. SWRI153]|uniref:Uncharacterized protein n=1 Tax=Pseudomonas khorasanensis TaxID=2745508 RepID=A0A923JIX5_9PSED|nr:hypothetical protein [Pseudomonas khorasanensis]